MPTLAFEVLKQICPRDTLSNFAIFNLKTTKLMSTLAFKVLKKSALVVSYQTLAFTKTISNKSASDVIFYQTFTFSTYKLQDLYICLGI